LQRPTWLRFITFLNYRALAPLLFKIVFVWSFDIYIKGGLTGATVAFVLSAGRLVVARQRRQFACSQRRSKALREATQV